MHMESTKMREHHRIQKWEAAFHVVAFPRRGQLILLSL